jgi:flavin reductase (DIM6/NTAB) family NADH-FMN oxidoreductase RutF
VREKGVGADIREAMARVPAATVVVTTLSPEGFRALTATTFVAVSLEPPLVLACLDSLAATRDAVAGSEVFAVSVLERADEFLAERFSGRAPLVDPAWREVPHRLATSGAPILERAVAWFDCRLRELRPAGDHDLAVGSVLDWGTGGGEPLVYWDRAFWRLS